MSFGGKLGKSPPKSNHVAINLIFQFYGKNDVVLLETFCSQDVNPQTDRRTDGRTDARTRKHDQQ